MACDLRCGRRILLEDRVPIGALISLDALRLKTPPNRLDHLRHDLKASTEQDAGVSESVLQEDVFDACVKGVAMKGCLPLYVSDPQRHFAHRIRPDVIRNGCCCWSVFDASCEGRFFTKPALMRHNSLEALYDGQPIYVRPISLSRLMEVVGEVIDLANAQGLDLTNVELFRRVQAHPEVRMVSKRRIEAIARERKPEKWKRPGPRKQPPSS